MTWTDVPVRVGALLWHVIEAAFTGDMSIVGTATCRLHRGALH